MKQIKLITIAYWIKLLLVTVVSVMYNHGIYECITVWCVVEFLRTSLLIAYLLRDLWDAILFYRLLIGSEIQFCQLLFNCVSSGFFNAAAYATWHLSNLRLLLWFALTALVSSALMLEDPIAMKMHIVDREGGILWDAVSSRLIATPRCCFIVAWTCSFDPETVGS